MHYFNHVIFINILHQCVILIRVNGFCFNLHDSDLNIEQQWWKKKLKSEINQIICWDFVWLEQLPLPSFMFSHLLFPLSLSSSLFDPCQIHGVNFSLWFFYLLVLNSDALPSFYDFSPMWICGFRRECYPSTFNIIDVELMYLRWKDSENFKTLLFVFTLRK